MKISICSDRQLLKPCNLDLFDYQLDTYVGCEHHCHYCYALKDAETDWRQEIQIHSDFENRLDRELSTISPQSIYMGYNTDPYQPCESDMMQTRHALQIMESGGFSASILTKSDLVLRDMDILTEMEDASVSISVAFNNNKIRSLLEDKTKETSARIEALTELKKAGIRTGALLCPVIPYISDTIDLLNELASCADRIWVYRLSVDDSDPKDTGWINTRKILSSQFPEISDTVTSIILSKDHEYWKKLSGEITDFATEHRLDVRNHL